MNPNDQLHDTWKLHMVPQTTGERNALKPPAQHD